MAANAAGEPAPPPTSALPQLPVFKMRQPSSSSDSPTISRLPSTSSRSALRTPSKISKPTSILNASYNASSPNIATLRSVSSNTPKDQDEDPSADKELRRSVSIANFPQPPKSRSGSKRGSAESNADSQRGGESASRAVSTRLRKLKTKAYTGSMNQLYNGGPAPSLMNGKGDSKTVSGSRESSGLASLHSPPHSRSSSAQDSYSTSATTFEDGEDKRSPREDGVQNRRGRDSGSKKEEPKGNVIVSVRVRPDAAGDKSSAKEWLVDRRQSLVAYKGREGGDYYYGEPLHLSLRFRSPITGSSFHTPNGLSFLLGNANSIFEHWLACGHQIYLPLSGI